MYNYAITGLHIQLILSWCRGWLMDFYDAFDMDSIVYNQWSTDSALIRRKLPSGKQT